MFNDVLCSNFKQLLIDGDVNFSNYSPWFGKNIMLGDHSLTIPTSFYRMYNIEEGWYLKIILSKKNDEHSDIQDVIEKILSHFLLESEGFSISLRLNDIAMNGKY